MLQSLCRRSVGGRHSSGDDYNNYHIIIHMTIINTCYIIIHYMLAFAVHLYVYILQVPKSLLPDTRWSRYLFYLRKGLPRLDVRERDKSVCRAEQALRDLSPGGCFRCRRRLRLLTHIYIYIYREREIYIYI